MANFYGTARSNYFQVKDLEEFKRQCCLFDLAVDERFEDGAGVSVIIYPDKAESGCWPSGFWDEDLGDMVEFDVADFVQEHIADNQCAILFEIGNENLRYLHGIAIAVTKDKIETVSLHDIYNIAAKMVTSEVTRAEY